MARKGLFKFGFTLTPIKIWGNELVDVGVDSEMPG